MNGMRILIKEPHKNLGLEDSLDQQQVAA